MESGSKDLSGLPLLSRLFAILSVSALWSVSLRSVSRTLELFQSRFWKYIFFLTSDLNVLYFGDARNRAYILFKNDI